MRKYSKMIFRVVAVFGLILCFAGCGNESIGNGNKGAVPAQYYDISSKKSELFGKTISSEPGMFLGMQYYQGEIIQLRTQGADVYLYHEDGSKELLVENMPEASQMLWFLDSEGNCYCWEQDFMLSEVMGQNKKENYSILKLDSSGKEIYLSQLGRGVKPLDICQLADGRIIVLLENQEEAAEEAAELNPSTGLITAIREIQLSYGIPRYIAAGAQGLLLLENGIAAEISEVSLADGRILSTQSFASSSYSLGEKTPDMYVEDFRIQEDGGVEILWADPATARGVRETLQLKEIEKIPIVLATPYTIQSWMLGKIAEFNRTNDTYHVIPLYGDGSDQPDRDARLQIEMATGKGPDILFEDALYNMGALVDKGGFEDLAPYMENSGMKEEDYFPSAFSFWREGEKIYTARMHAGISVSYIRSDIAGGKRPENLEAFVDAMLGLDEKRKVSGWISSYIVANRVAFSEDSGGIIDWEQGTCDFNAELFIKLMKMAERYGFITLEEVIRNDKEALDPFEIYESVSCSSFLHYVTVDEMEKQGWVLNEQCIDGVVYLSLGSYPNMTFAINANSSHKEGAWEFIRFMMSEDVQKTMDMYLMSTNRQAFKAQLDNELKGLEYWVEKDKMITEERIAEYCSMFENAIIDDSANDRKVQPVADIIEEECRYYFTGQKSMEDVIDVLNNRVQLYLDENK